MPKKYRSYACFVCCARFKKYTAFSRFADERLEERLLSLQVLSSHFGVPLGPVHSAASNFKRKESFYCRSCAKWFQRILSGTSIDAVALESEILKLQETLLKKLKQLHASSWKVKEGVEGIKAILDKTEQEGPVGCKKGKGDQVVDHEGAGGKNLPKRVWKLRQSLLSRGIDGSCTMKNEAEDTSSSEDENEGSSSNQKQLKNIAEAFPKNFLVQLEGDKIQGKIEKAENSRGPLMQEDPLSCCSAVVKEEPADQDCYESYEDDFIDGEGSGEMVDENVDEAGLTYSVNSVNLINLKGLSDDEDSSVNDCMETIGYTGDDYPEAGVLRSLPKRSTTIKRKKHSSDSSESNTDTDSDSDDSDPDFLEEDTKAERKQKAFEKRAKKDEEFLKEYDLHMGLLQPTATPGVMTWKGVEVIVKDDGAMECGVCGVVKDTRVTTGWQSRQIRDHICKDHLGGVTCPICESEGKERKISGYRLLLVHLHRHPNKHRIHLCPVCGKPFRDPEGNSFVFHMWSHKNAEEQQAEIDKGVVPPKLRPLPKRIPGVVGAHLCAECGKDFPSKKSLEAHKVCHTDKEEREKTRVACPECGKMYYPTTINMHIRHYHRRIVPVKRHICDFENCGKNFASKSLLHMHKQRHTQEFRFFCECGKGFPSRSSMKTHSSKHTDLKQFACELCSTSFKYARNLVRHKLTSHKGEIDTSTGNLIT